MDQPRGGTARAGSGYHVRAGAILAAPAGDDYDRCRLIQRLLDAVEHTPRGATIRIVTYSFTLTTVAEALAAAHERGVHVQVVVDGPATRGGEATATLEDAIGEDRTARSFLVRVHGAARGGPEGNQHQKTWMFSRAGASRWVTIVGSENLTGGCFTQYNNAYAFVGRRDVYRAFGSIFAQQVRDRPVDDPGVLVDLDGVRAWFLPGFADDDPVQQLLADVPAGPGTRVQILQYAWSGERGLDIAQQVVEQRAGGSRVQVLVSRALGSVVERRLTDGGIDVHRAPFADGTYVHHKLLLLSWLDGAGSRRRVIVTGSANLGEAPFVNDEVVVAIDADRGVPLRSWRSYRRGAGSVLARARREGT